MSTPSSKRQHIPHSRQSGADEGKEEKKVEADYFPLQQLSSLPRNWFCANTALSRRACIQRTPRDIENWKTKFSSGLQGGMTEDECKQTCIYSAAEPQQSTMVVPQKYKILGREEPVEVPGMNSRFVNNLISSMLSTKDIRGLIPTSRANYVGIDPEQKKSTRFGIATVGINQRIFEPTLFKHGTKNTSTARFRGHKISKLFVTSATSSKDYPS